MKFDVERILREADEDYEAAWVNSAKDLPREGRKFNLLKKTRPHPVPELSQKMRTTMLRLGFEEVVLPMFVDESDVYKEYGPEAALILDRLYYLAELPRPEIGLSKKKISQIKVLAPMFEDFDALADIFRRYKRGTIESDDLIETLVEELGIREVEASSILDRVFPEFKQLMPVPTKKTLRSHTTALWFPVLGAVQGKAQLPIQYFTIGPKFRREQHLDATHLYCSETLSLVVEAEEITLEDAMEIGKRVVKELGFKDSRTEIKVATSKYYAPQTEFEIFGLHPSTGEWVEIGDGGFYSPVSCARFGIAHPVVNIGFGVERTAMLITGEEDIRKLVYPYFYRALSFTDSEIASAIHFEFRPETQAGKEIADSVVKVVTEHKDDESPVEILAWKGEVGGKLVEVTVWETDPGVKLVGPATFNKIVVSGGNVTGTNKPPDQGAVDTSLSYLRGVAELVGYKAEKLAREGSAEEVVRVKMCKRIGDVNLVLDERVHDFITANQKKIDVRGPIFLGVTIRSSE
ncbi:MAG: O-phosphoserine--tRNA ligase [Promethearchaeota archaeon]